MAVLTILVGVFLIAHGLHNCNGCAPSCGNTLVETNFDPPTRKTIGRVLVSSIEEARWRGTCHSFCVTNVDINIDIEKTNSLLSWPAVHQLNGKCVRKAAYLKCLEGCVSRGFHRTTGAHCQDDCNTNCTNCFDLDICKIDDCNNLRCGMSVDDCRTGCRGGKSLRTTNGKLPAAPSNSNINILFTSTAGTFLLDVQATQPNSTITSSLIHSFVVRIDGTVNGNSITQYWWMRDLEVTALDLREFICAEVDLSFAVINEHGVSGFSPNKSFCIESFSLLPPPAVSVVFKETDVNQKPTTCGLFTMKLNWTQSTGLPLSEIQYRVNVIGKTCQNSFEMVVTSNTSRISVPGYTSGCALSVMVSTLFRGSESNPNISSIIVENAPDNLLVDHTLEQDKYTGHFNFTLYWSLRSHDPLLLMVIAFFRIGLLGDFPARPKLETIDASQNKFDYSKTFLLTPLQDGGEISFQYLITVSRVTGFNCRGQLIIPSSPTISYKGTPPSAAADVEVLNGTVDFATSSLLLDITWKPPYPYGKLVAYKLILTAEFDNENKTFNQTLASRFFPPNISLISLNVTISPNIEVYFLQLYSDNIFGTSQPAILQFKVQDYLPDNTTVPPLTPAETPVQSEANTTPTFAYYIIGIGCALLIIVLVFVVYCCVRTCYLKWSEANVTFPTAKNPLYSETARDISLQLQLVECHSITADAWEISPDHILLGKELGSGFFGEVYRCTIQGPIITPYTERNQLSKSIALPAAVKILKENAIEKIRSDFIKEIELMKRAGEQYNSHVVSMICCTINEEPNALVLEYVEHGDLLQYLQKNKVFVMKNKIKEEPSDMNKAIPYLEPSDQYSHLAPREMSSPYDHLRKVLSDNDSAIEDLYPDLKQLLPVDMVTFAYQIADGMEYLTSLGILHRDLACRNVLVAADKVLKISDFGLARQLNDNLVYYRSQGGKLPIRWMAPEAIRDRVFNTYTDIWSYGVTLWEICTLGGFPYPLLSNRDVLEALLDGQRLEKPPSCSEDMYDIMLDCWKADPELRPSFSFLKGKTEEMIQNANQDYPYLDFKLNDYLPYCNLRLTNEAGSTENILDDLVPENEEDEMKYKDENSEKSEKEKQDI